MKLYCEKENYKLYHGSMLDMLEVIDKNSVDCIVTDPPYELNFMGKGWDNAGVSFNKETWKKCFDVLKDGGYLLAFGGSRTYHRIACAIEDAGFEIRDCIMWLYGSGFPKSMNIGLAIDKKTGVESKVVGIKEHCKKDFKENNLYAQDEANKNNTKCFGYGTEIVREAQNEWQGWGTCLKPAYEPIIIARKPFKGSLVDNVIKNGIGGLNIDECRVGTGTGKEKPLYEPNNKNNVYNKNFGGEKYENTNGRFPANIIHDGSDEVCEGFPNTKSGKIAKEYKQNTRFNIAKKGKGGNLDFSNCYGDSGSVARYFYCAKASKKDRDEGLDTFEDKKFFSTLNTKNGSGERLDGAQTPVRKNIHPTVKPTELMQYLVRLIAPKNATILDPFMGSGSTGKAVMYENKERDKNYKFIGIELTEEYLPIAEARINYVANRNPYEFEDAEFDGEQCNDIAIKIGVLKELLEE